MRVVVVVVVVVDAGGGVVGWVMVVALSTQVVGLWVRLWLSSCVSK